jgi:PAS domain S-box-containing protein
MTGTINKSGEKIFIVEDVPDNLTLISTILQEYGYTTASARNGKTAIASIIANPPGLVLLDIKMPDTDGFEVCRAIKNNKNTSSIPVIFLSALSEITDKQKGFAAGGVDYITKPFNVLEVLKRVEIHLEIGRLRRQLENQAIELNATNQQLQLEITERKRASEKLESSYKKLSNSKKAALNLLEDLKTEIEERKKSEEIALENEQRFRGFIENASDVVYSLSLDGIFTYISPNEPGSLGGFAVEALGKSFESIVHPEDVNIGWAFLNQILETGNSVTSRDYRVLTGDGKVRWHSSRGSALLDGEGKIHGFLGITRDITQRKLADDALQQSEEKFRKAFLTSPDSININRLHDGMYIQINKGFTTIMGYKEEEIIGKTSLELNVWKNPKDRELLVEGLKSKAYVENLEAEFCAKNGETRYGLMSAAIIELNGEVHILSITRDITERRKAEDSLKEGDRLLRESQTIAGLGSYIWNISTGLWSSSDVLDEIFGIDDNYVRSLEGWTKIVHPGWQDTMARYVGEEVIGKNKRFDKEYKIVRQDNGEVRWVHGLGELEQNSIRGSLILIGTIKDITEQKTAEEEILKLNAELEERVVKRTSQLEASNKELEAFSYSISHDLRAPLRHISGFINLFLENKTTKLTAEELGYLKTVTNSANEMGRLIDALLTFSRLQRAELQKTPIDTQQLVNMGLQFFQQDLKSRKIEFNIGSLQETHGDPQLIRQVWTNLLSNAIKYTSKREDARIDIGSYVENEEVIFFIKDNGTGFDMKYGEKLFGVFQRLHKPRDFEGVGIGLANVKRIVTRHGGRCWAEGEVGKGAAFYFSLPLRST